METYTRTEVEKAMKETKIVINFCGRDLQVIETIDPKFEEAECCCYCPFDIMEGGCNHTRECHEAIGEDHVFFDKELYRECILNG